MLNLFHYNNRAYKFHANFIFFLLILGSVTEFVATETIASRRDLHFAATYFEQQVTTWTGSSLSSSDGANTTLMSTTCGNPLLGGPGIQSTTSGKFSKSFDSSLSHVSVYVTLDITMIDAWGSSAYVEAFLNDTLMGSFTFSSYSNSWASNLCGKSLENDLGSIKVFFAGTFSESTLSIALSKYTDGASTDGQFGIKNVNIAISNKNVSEVAAFSGNSQGVCVYLSSGQISDSYRCPCSLYQYNDTSTDNCRSCHSSCETCYGGLETQCLTCAEGYTYDGNVCIQCDSTCDTCFGTDSNQCATCPGGSYLYPDSTCRTTCDSADIVTDGEYSSCNGFHCTASNTLNYEQVKDGPLYYYPDTSNCKNTCPSPYVITPTDNITLCELPVSQQDRRTVAQLESAGATTGAIMTAGVTVMTALSPSNPSAMSVATLSKLFEYTRQYDVTRSPRLELYYKSHRATPGTILIGPDLTNEQAAKFTYHPLPQIFVQNNLYSSFLVNFFQTFETLLIICGVVLFLFGVKSVVTRKCPRFVDLVQKIIIAVIAFLITQFYGIYAQILFLGTLEFMPFIGGNGLAWLSFFFAVILYLFALFLLAFHFMLIWKYQKIKVKAGTEEGDKKIKEFQIKHQKVEVLYKDFKDFTFVEQSFLLFLTTRAYITGIVMAALWAYPGIQIVFNILINILTIVYLSFKSPYKSLPTVFQQIVYELNFLLVNICFLIMAALDVSQGQNDPLRAFLGDVIINAILASKFIPVITVVPMIVGGVLQAIKIIKDRKKSKNNSEMAAESTLPVVKKEGIMTPDETQPMIKVEGVVIELSERQHNEGNSSHSSGQQPPETIQPIKLDDIRADMISKTCLGGEGNEFDNEGMSPIMQIYYRETLINKDVDTPKTCSHQPSETAIKLMNLKNPKD